MCLRSKCIAYIECGYITKIFLTKDFRYCTISTVANHNRLHISCAVVAQLDRALGYGPRCREFESSQPHILKQISLTYLLFILL